MNYEQYLEDYWPEEESNDSTPEQYSTYYYGQVTCIDRQIAELEARRDALLHGYCFTGQLYREAKPFMDPYNLAVDWQHSIPEVEVVEKKKEEQK